MKENHLINEFKVIELEQRLEMSTVEAQWCRFNNPVDVEGKCDIYDI